MRGRGRGRVRLGRGGLIHRVYQFVLNRFSVVNMMFDNVDLLLRTTKYGTIFECRLLHEESSRAFPRNRKKTYKV